MSTKVRKVQKYQCLGKKYLKQGIGTTGGQGQRPESGVPLPGVLLFKAVRPAAINLGCPPPPHREKAPSGSA